MLCLACCASFLGAHEIAVRPSSTRISTSAGTVAGSGLPGNADGPIGQATFVEPFGIAVASDGEIYVSDIGGQRIRAIHGGVVSTVAGSGEPPAGSDRVPGGYRNGIASQARFNKPMGLALLPDGTLLVADTWNNCIRAIRAGMVSTLTGNPKHAGSADGDLKDATFMEPRALAVDRTGTIYVADRGINGSGGGLRKITPEGKVSTIQLPASVKSTIIGIAVGPSRRHPRLYLSDMKGLVELDLRSGRISTFSGNAQGERKFGYPDSLLAVGDSVVFTDARTHTVRLFHDPLTPGHPGFSQPLNYPRPDDAADNGGGYRNGAMHGALFDSPRGIARDRNGDLIIADSGNRRVRKIISPDIRMPVRTLGGHLLGHEMTILGGTSLFFDTLWAGSIPGRLESDVGKRIDALQYDDTSRTDIARDVDAVAQSDARARIWLLSSHELDALGSQELRDELHKFGRSLPKAVVVILPYSNELPGASRFVALAIGNPRRNGVRARAHFDLLRQIVRQSGVRYIDLTQSLLRYERTNARGALYSVLTPYLTNIGRDVVARYLAKKVSAR